MSNLKTCDCLRQYYRVVHRHHNHSYFESPQGQPHYSNYSGIVCMRCGWRFRTKAKWVNGCPDLNEQEEQKCLNHDFPIGVNVRDVGTLYYYKE